MGLRREERIHHPHSISLFFADHPPILPSVSTDDCPGEDWTAYGRYCFKAFMEEDNILGQPSAKYYCRQFQHTDLVSLHSKEENDFIGHFVDQGIYSIWLGLESDNGEGKSYRCCSHDAAENIHPPLLPSPFKKLWSLKLM